jgi:hypothetical protein|tara:strand:- start:165 stop:419 length:255 start_codon:yes stop_codon:yes gene_type:complete
MRYLLIMLLAGCASVQSVKEPFVTIDENGDPYTYHTLDSATQIETVDLLGAGDALGVDTYQRMEENASKKVLDPWLYLDGLLRY